MHLIPRPQFIKAEVLQDIQSPPWFKMRELSENPSLPVVGMAWRPALRCWQSFPGLLHSHNSKCQQDSHLLFMVCLSDPLHPRRVTWVRSERIAALVLPLLA